MSSQGKTRKGVATICVVNYKTELLTRLCLRSIRKFTRRPFEMIVVDNDSGDASLDYLRSLSWIRLIERPGEVVKSGSWAHGTALDKGLEACDTEFFVAMHSDTFVHKDGWLDLLLSKFEKDERVACAGTGKLEIKPKWLSLIKKCTDFQSWMKRLSPSAPRDDFYIRAICACYKTGALMDEGLRFAMNVDDGVTCGKQLYYELVDRGHGTSVITSEKMSDYVYHLAHATMALNPEFTVRKRTERKCLRQMEGLLGSRLAKEILSDDSLDK